MKDPAGAAAPEVSIAAVNEQSGGRQGAPNAGDGHGVFTRGIRAATGTSYLFFEGVLSPMTPDTPMGRSRRTLDA